MASAALKNRLAVNFRSVDSAPVKLARTVSWWQAPAMLACFCLLSVAQLYLVSLPAAREVFFAYDYVLSAYTGSASISIRIFFISFYISFCLFNTGRIRARLALLVEFLVMFTLICAIFDIFNSVIASLTEFRISLHAVQITAGIFGFIIFSFSLLRRAAMPERKRVRHRSLRFGDSVFKVLVATVIAAIASFFAARGSFELVEVLRSVALLGGLGPGVILFLFLLFLQLYIVGRLEQAFSKERSYHPDVSIIVPAHNEAFTIVQTIRALEAAAADYDGEVTALIMNNASTDETGDLAIEALAACKVLKGKVIDVPAPGKANALNAGLAAVETAYFIRVDADTQLRADNIRLAMQNFADPTIGVVGGIPLPPGGGAFDRVRHVEVLLKHGFYSIALSAIDALVGVPGMFVCYRTRQVMRIGGFPFGLNGEDTDVSLRVAELGFRSVVDPRVKYCSEVPVRWGHLREQRLRWFRSTYHVSARCFDLLDSAMPTLRGKLILPYMLVNSARRAMMVPLFVFGIVQFLFARNPHSAVTWQAILAVMIGAPALAAVMACLINRQPKALLGLPEYIGFRAVRAYFTLESTMTMITLTGRSGPARRRRERPNPFRSRLAELDIPALPVPQRARVGRRWISVLPWLAALTIATGLADRASAQEEARWGVAEEAWIANENVPPDVVESGEGQNRLLPSLNSRTSLIYEVRKPHYQGLRVDGGLVLEAYPDDSDLNRWGFDAGAQWRQNLDAANRWQLRLEGQATFMNDPDEHIYSRIRGGSVLRYRHSARHVSKMRLRTGYRDQNDDRFQGFDQTELRAEIGHDWRPGDRAYLSGTLFGESIDADADRYSYQEFGLFFWGRVPLTDRLELSGRVNAYRREYEDDFSALYPFAREDTRFWPRVGLDYFVTDHFSLFGEIGYDSNESNIPSRDYDGVTGRIGFRVDGNVGELLEPLPDRSMRD